MGWLWQPFAPSGAAEITGTSSVTLGGVTGSATGVVTDAEITGTSSVTLAGLVTGSDIFSWASYAYGVANVLGTSTGTLDGTTGSATGAVSDGVISFGTSTGTLGTTGSATGVVDVVGASSVTVAGVTGSALGSDGSVVALVTFARLSVPTVLAILDGFSSRQLGGSTGSATGSAPALGASSGTLGTTGTATGTVASIEQMRVTRAMFSAPEAVGGSRTGTSSATLAGVTGSATVNDGTEKIGVTWAQLETPPGFTESFIDMPVDLSPAATITITLSATVEINVGALATASGAQEGVTGSATGLLSSLQPGETGGASIADLAGVSGSATGGVAIVGTAADSYASVTGSATAVTIPLVATLGNSTQTLAGVTAESTAVSEITGISVGILGGVFADVTLFSVVTLAGVSGYARGGLRGRPARKMRTPSTRANEQIRPIGRPSTLFSISAITLQGTIGNAQGFIDDVLGDSAITAGVTGSATGGVLTLADSTQATGDVTGSATGVSLIEATASGAVGDVTGSADGLVTGP